MNQVTPMLPGAVSEDVEERLTALYEQIESFRRGMRGKGDSRFSTMSDGTRVQVSS